MKRIKLQEKIETEISMCLGLAMKIDMHPKHYVEITAMRIKDFVQNNYRRRKR